MKIVTFGTLKGGSGKTTNIFNVAGELALKNRVLLIDADPQCNLSANCGIDISDSNLKSIKDIFEKSDEQPTPNEIISRKPIDELPNLDIITSNIFLFETEEKMVTISNRESFLKFYIEDYMDYFERNYDYILIDTNPSMSIININAFYVADSIVLTSDISNNSITGAELFIDLWNSKRKPLRKENNVSALLVCNNDRRANLGRDLVEYISNEDFSQDLLLKTVIPSSKKLKDAELYHKPVSVLYSKSEIAKLYRDVVKELKKKGVF